MWRKLFCRHGLVVAVRGECNEYAQGRIMGIIQSVLNMDGDAFLRKIHVVCAQDDSSDFKSFYVAVFSGVSYAQRDRIEKLIGKVTPGKMTVYLV
jgi:hypothetical protein